eukprot:Platyproteum_vivax@DN2818_c0_g1_i1.p1
MVDKREEAKGHIKLAEKALKKNVLALKFKPDYLTAGLEYKEAASTFQLAGATEDAAEAWVKAAECQETIDDYYSAGRSYEAAGNLFEKKNINKAIEFWKLGAGQFRLKSKTDIAVKLYMKIASACEDAHQLDGAKEAYIDALDAYNDDEKWHMVSDIHKKYVQFLAGANLLKDLLPALDQQIENLMRLNQNAFVYKSILCKVIVNLKLNDLNEADGSLSKGAETDGQFLGSKEFSTGSELLQAFQENDSDLLQTAIKSNVINFLPVEIVKIGKSLHVTGTKKLGELDPTDDIESQLM